MNKWPKDNWILFRPLINQVIPVSWLVIGILYFIHATLRFGGLWNPVFIPFSLIILWPLPWLLSTKEGRRTMGFKGPVTARWFLTGPLAALVLLLIAALTSWVFFGDSEANWLAQHATFLDESLRSLPSETDVFVLFAVATLPAMLFSPLGEEFLYRGFMLADFTASWGYRAAMLVQASAFALLHLAHYGLNPFQPDLIAVFIPSIFVAGLAFGWIRYKSGSIWVAVWSHSIFNLGMNGIVFWWY